MIHLGLPDAVRSVSLDSRRSDFFRPGVLKRPHQTVIEGDEEMFVLGQTYNRRELHSLYGGQRQGGISTPSDHPFILLFTGVQGQQYGYKDGWSEDGLFLYTGEGQVGDMDFLRGNRAIRDHMEDGKDLHLFEYIQRGLVRYAGQMVYTGFQEKQAPDREGSSRRVIVFELAPIGVFAAPAEAEEPEEAELWEKPLEVLRNRALSASSLARSPAERRQSVRYRSQAIRVYVHKRADGSCEGCGQQAPFKTDAGAPYLEPHHIRRLSDGGPDHPDWVAALCPNCHRRVHYSADRTDFNNRIGALVKEKEARLQAGAETGLG